MGGEQYSSGNVNNMIKAFKPYGSGGREDPGANKKSPSLCKEELKDIENQPDYARVFTFLASLLFRLAALFL